MRLVAIYIKENHLFYRSQVTNLGGKYFYNIIERPNEQEYELTRTENKNFITNFWGENISLVSAIVGENGSGKTTLLKQLDTYDSFFPNTFFIWEENENLFFTQVYYSQYSRLQPRIFFNGKELQNKSEILEFTQSIYYSPTLNYKQSRYREYYTTRFYNTSRATVYLTLNTLLRQNSSDLNNFISENLKRELIFCERFKDFSKQYPFLNYNVQFFTTRDKLSRVNTELSENDKKYEEAYKSIESKLKLGLFTNINYNYPLPFEFYIEFILYLKYYFEKEINYTMETESLDGNLDKVIEKFFHKPRRFKRRDINERYENIKKLYFLIVEKSINDYSFSRKDALEIINLQERIAFSVKMKDPKISGVQFFTPEPINTLSSGEKSLINLFSNIYASFSSTYLKDIDEKIDVNKQFIDYSQKTERIILLLDEADLGFHPQWKKKYIKIITDIFPEIFKEINGFKSLQIIITTHDSLTLSDIPNSNIVYLKKEGNKTKILGQNEKPKKSFGANITDLLSDNFFIEDGLMGDFAKDKIEEVIKYLNDDESLIKEAVEAKKIIDIIDEPILKYKLRDMFFEKFPEEYDLEKEKEEIRKRAIELGIITE